MTTEGITEVELRAKLAALEPLTDAQRKSITCSLIGHSKIQEHCFGYWYCGRCGTQVGDSLGGTYDPTDTVVIGHRCERCKTNYESCDWKDKLFVPDPFAESES